MRLDRLRYSAWMAPVLTAALVASLSGSDGSRALAASGLRAAQDRVRTPTAALPAAVQSCWDFASLPPTNVYHIGDVFLAPTATIEMKNYLWNGNKTTSPANQAYVTQTQISGGPAPEFRMYLVNAHVEPNTPVTNVSFNFGHFASPTGAHANIGVNGELVEVTNSLLDLNGRVLGDPAIGTAQVNVVLVSAPGASPQVGTLELVAITGQIEKFTEGGVQLFIKNVCMS